MSSASLSPNLVDPSHRFLGPDFKVGPLAYGLWRFTDPDVAAAQALIETALESGMNLIDTADIYGLGFGGTHFGHVEEILGTVLAASPGLRDQMVLATKGGIMPPLPYDSSHGYINDAVDASLRRLQVDVIDVWQVHRPDMFTHPAQLAETLDGLRRAGKIREVGVSNYSPHQYDALVEYLPFKLVSTQPEFSVLELSPMVDGTFDKAMRDGVTPMAWSPLGGGRLFADGKDGYDAPPEDLITQLDELAAREGVDRAAIAFAFVIAHPSRPIAIVGTQNPVRIRAAVDALKVTLTRDDVYSIMESGGFHLP